MKTVSFTGHRPDKFLGKYDESHLQTRAIKGELAKQIKALVEIGYGEFISGGALGIDTWAAEIIVEFKKAKPNLKLTIAKPFPSQDSMWPEESKTRFKGFCDSADKIVDVSDDPYAAWKMQTRNEWMVDNSDLVLAVWDGSSGGTGNCVKYAKKKNKEIIIIDPSKIVYGPKSAGLQMVLPLDGMS